jgi:formiminoglutamase
MSKINNPFYFHQGDSPLLVSMPHSGLNLLESMDDRLTPAAKPLPDTDWYIPELYNFLETLNVSIINANYSRYVVDLNRPVDDKPLYTSKTTGLFPDILFADSPVFLPQQQHNDELKAQIKTDIWQAYHQQIATELTRIKAKFGYAILFDAHSIADRVPMLFEGKLADFNFGNNEGATCAADLLKQLADIIENTPYSQVSNGRFKGGYITRHYGKPENNIHAIQLELSQATYLAEGTDGYQLDTLKKQTISPILQQLIESLLNADQPTFCN